MSKIGRNDAVPDGPGQSTPKLYADRVRVYPAAVQGPMRRLKWSILIVCLCIYYALPWIRWNRGLHGPDQAILLDIGQRRFYIFDLEFWPQDVVFLAGTLILAAVALFFVTSLFGRVWCGYACPQTVWTDLFFWIERKLEGDRNARMRRDAAPMCFDTAWRKLAKHGIWLAAAFWTGGAWIMYFQDAPTVATSFWTGAAPAPVYVFTFLFTATTYLLAGWAREQVCTYMCPWPRFQSAMLDEQSLTVTYRRARGEPRMWGRAAAHGKVGAGDCIDCGMCVAVCPTGIDIRDGIQLECINCGLCMDACNHAMEKLGRRKWLIAWDTLARQDVRSGETPPRLRLLRPRSAIYLAALSVALLVMLGALVSRQTLSISVLRDRAPLFVVLPDGDVRNGYTLRILDESASGGEGRLRVEGLPGARITLAGSGAAPVPELALAVAADQIGTVHVLVQAPLASVGRSATPVRFVLDLPPHRPARHASEFLGPVTP